MHYASEVHLKAAKRFIRYIKGTINYGVKFQKSQNLKLLGYSDSDWVGSVDDMKSTSGYCFSLGSRIFSWYSNKQDIVAQSTAEAEFVATTSATNQALWLRKILVDNQAAIAISHNPVFHGKNKHLNIKFFFLRDVQKNSDVTLLYCKTKEQLADIFTKSLPAKKFELLRQKLGVCIS
ncbi:secreted RxLR effector protein 161-like [Nicotiana tabacum]|uniref:Secreted RxLR effector protein 161-like n=1 Tax=Nicotiana tabacum TaxID=4097 RepID=A0AC58TPX6_TOBAC